MQTFNVLFDTNVYINAKYEFSRASLLSLKNMKIRESLTYIQTTLSIENLLNISNLKWQSWHYKLKII